MTRILVIDDEPVVADLMAEMLGESGYEAVRATDAADALARLDDPRVALVLSDVVMPGLSEVELLDEVRRRRPSLPVVLVACAGTAGRLAAALERGASGHVTKPFSRRDLVEQVDAALERAVRTDRELRERLLAPTLASTLANAIESRDAGAHGHCERMSSLAVRLARELQLPEATVEAVRLGAILHDVGTIGIPDRILRKKGRLTASELATMREHTVVGDRLLASLDLLDDVRLVVRHHHERCDGGGYPDGLAGEDIPLAARVVAVADALEAMSAPRIYREPLAAEQIAEELRRGRGRQWDATVVDLTLELIGRGDIRFDGHGATVGPGERGRGILLVHRDGGAAQAHRALERSLTGVPVTATTEIASAERLARSGTYSLVVVDDRLPGGGALRLLERLQRTVPGLPAVVLTAGGDADSAREAFRRGARGWVDENGDLDAELTGRVRALIGAP